MSTPSLGQGFDEVIPLVLVLDTSASMARPEGAPRIAELNAALGEWLTDAAAQPGLRDRLQVALVTFDSQVQVLDPATGVPAAPGAASAEEAFSPVGEVATPELRAGGLSLMLPAITVAVDLATERSRQLNARGVPSQRPLVWLLTDGAPSDERGARPSDREMSDAARRLRAAEQASEHTPGCLFYAIGVGGADRGTLQTLSPNGTMMLRGFSYRDVLRLVSRSAPAVQSSPTAEAAYEQTRQMADLESGLRRLEEEFG